MDKNTLSNYGWIVIAVLVLSVMIALATPFGSYIEQGVRATTEGLFSTSQNAMNSAFNAMGVEVKDQTFEEGYTGVDNNPKTVVITFTFNGVEYQAEENMLVSKWVSSKFNTITEYEFKIENNDIYVTEPPSTMQLYLQYKDETQEFGASQLRADSILQNGMEIKTNSGPIPI